MTSKSVHIGRFLLFLFFTTVLVLISAGVFAQAKFSTVVNQQQVGENEYIEVEYNILNASSVEQFAYPTFKKFRIVRGPIQSSGMSIMNGVRSEYKGISFVLQPVSKGKLVVPGATALIDGKAMRSNSVVVEVVPGVAGSVPPSVPGLSPRPVTPDVTEEYVIASDEDLAEKLKNNLMVVAQVNKNSCYEGEPIVATYKLYSRLRSESRVTKRPSLNGFSVFDMVDQESNNPTVETLNGKTYNVHLIRKTQLFPLQAGTFTLDPVELENKVRFVKTNRKKSAKSPFPSYMDEFFGDEGMDDIQEHNFTLGSKPLSITVKPLPVENKPANFNGAVGQFTIAAALKNAEIPAGDAIELKLAIKGAGNFTMINPPALTLPAGIHAYEPTIKEAVDKTIYPLKGTKTFEYILTGKDTGSFTIAPIPFSYFDPAGATYKTVYSEPFQVHILPAVHAKEDKQNAVSLPLLADVRGDGFPVKALLLALGVLFVAALGVYQWRISKKHAKRVKEIVPAPVAEVTAVKTIVTKDLLEEARWALQTGESQRFYKEVNKAAWKVITDKVNIPATGLNKPNTIRQLQYKGVKAEVIEKFESVLNECEMALYTPVHDITDMHQTLDKAEDVIKTLKVTLT